MIAALTVIGLIAWATRAWSSIQIKARTAKFNEDVENLFIGLQKYKEIVGSYPLGGNADPPVRGRGGSRGLCLPCLGPETPWLPLPSGRLQVQPLTYSPRETIGLSTMLPSSRTIGGPRPA